MSPIVRTTIADEVRGLQTTDVIARRHELGRWDGAAPAVISGPDGLTRNVVLVDETDTPLTAERAIVALDREIAERRTAFATGDRFFA